jgi:hypothetical protein
MQPLIENKESGLTCFKEKLYISIDWLFVNKKNLLDESNDKVQGLVMLQGILHVSRHLFKSHDVHK